VRARVEHPFHVVKRIFGFVKVRYRGIAKNAHRLLVNFALSNLYLHRRHCYFYGRSVSRSWKMGPPKAGRPRKRRQFTYPKQFDPAMPGSGPILQSFSSYESEALKILRKEGYQVERNDELVREACGEYLAE
jgi:hypothetical protein